MSEAVIGQFLLIASLVHVPGAIIGGKLADKFNRKNVFLISQTISALLFFGVGFMGNSTSVPYVLILAFFISTFSYPALSALMMDYTTPENRQSSFSLNYLGMNIGIAIGPLIAGLLFENFTSWIFWGDAITTLLSVIMIGIMLVEIPKKDRVVEEDLSKEEQAHDGSTMSAILKRPIIVTFAVLCSLFSFAYAQTWFALPLQTSQLWGDLESTYFGYIISVNGIVVVAFTPLLLYFTKRLNPILNVVIGGLFYAVGFGIYGFTESLNIFLLAAIIWTLGEIVSSVNTSVYIANHSPVTHRARFQSIFEIIRGTGGAFGPLIMGAYLLTHPIKDLWVVTTAICLVGSALLYGLYLYEKGRKM